MKKVAILLLMVGASAYAQSSNESFHDKIPFLETNQTANKLTGVLAQDLFLAQPENLSNTDSLTMLETRSSLKAGLFSLLIPGAGQIYNGGTGNYIKAAGFLAIEAAAIAANIILTNKANNKTTYFQNYADGTSSEWNSYGTDGYVSGNSQVHYYNVYKYAQWLVNNVNAIEDNAGTTSSNRADISNNINKILKNSTFNPSLDPWLQVDWKYLNLVEAKMGGYFSHLLPPHGDQQYYELIGKYPQFRQGWSDENPAYLSFEQLNSDTKLSGYYMEQRGQANNLYGVAGTAIGVVIANHFLSAIEAAIWAHGHNKMVQTSVGVAPVRLQGVVVYQTQMNVAVNF